MGENLSSSSKIIGKPGPEEAFCGGDRHEQGRKEGGLHRPPLPRGKMFLTDRTIKPNQTRRRKLYWEEEDMFGGRAGRVFSRRDTAKGESSEQRSLKESYSLKKGAKRERAKKKNPGRVFVFVVGGVVWGVWVGVLGFGGGGGFGGLVCGWGLWCLGPCRRSLEAGGRNVNREEAFSFGRREHRTSKIYKTSSKGGGPTN